MYGDRDGFHPDSLILPVGVFFTTISASSDADRRPLVSDSIKIKQNYELQCSCSQKVLPVRSLHFVKRVEKRFNKIGKNLVSGSRKVESVGQQSSRI